MRISDWSSDVCSSDLIDGVEVGQFAIAGLQRRSVELQLLDGIRDPAFAEAFPCDHSDRLDTQHGPHRPYDSNGIRTRQTANAMRIRPATHFTGGVDGDLKAILAQLARVRPDKGHRGQPLQ